MQEENGEEAIQIYSDAIQILETALAQDQALLGEAFYRLGIAHHGQKRHQEALDVRTGMLS